MSGVDAAGQDHVDPDEAEPATDTTASATRVVTLPTTTAATPLGPRPRRTAEDYVTDILARASEPWVSLALDGAEISRLRLGSWAALIGAPGAGKTTLAVALLAEHARLHGPAVYLSLELGADEVAARAIGLAVGEGWEDVLRGKVPRDRMIAALPPRLDIRDRDVDDVNLAQLDGIVAQLRAAHPDEPIVSAVDYVQLAAGTGDDVRMRVAAIAEILRAAARRLRIVILGVSQPSRAAGRALRSGELVGADTMTAGAESADIERTAYATLAIGAPGQADGDGVTPVELHLGKGRFGGGDRVLPMRYEGRSGRWQVAGESKAAADVLAERSLRDNTQKTRAAADAVLAAAGRAKAPQTREQLRSAVQMGKTLVGAAVALLLEAGALVECEKAPRSKDHLLWTPARVAARRADREAAEAARMGDQ